MPFTDKTLVCRECGAQFVFTVGEQEFYLSRGLMNEPARCPECRSSRRQSRAGGTREMFKVTCASCGNEAQVPFQPRLDKPVYCNDCFAKTRSQRA